VTDPYQPIERRLKITRGCLEVLAEFRNPICIITKNQLVTRDIDLLGELARHRAAALCVSLTTLDSDLRKVMEPRNFTADGPIGNHRSTVASGHSHRRVARARDSRSYRSRDPRAA
jgi:hypothetical protein